MPKGIYKHKPHTTEWKEKMKNKKQTKMKKETIKIDLKRGYIKSEWDDTNYCLGNQQVPEDTINPSGDWTSFFPPDESQIEESFETFGCTIFNSWNCVESLAKFLFGETWNKSDRFNYIAANVDPARGGGDPHTACESIRKFGGINEIFLPFGETKTIQEFNSPKPLTQELLEKGKEFIRDYEYKHDWLPRTGNEISRETLKDALRKGTVNIAVFAWVEKGGKYIRPKGTSDTHWTSLAKVEDNGDLIVKDSYPPFTKTLTDNFPIYSAKRHYLRKKTEEEKKRESEQLGIFSKILSLLAKILMLDFQLLEEKKKENVIIEPKRAEAPIPPPISLYQWDNPQNVRHSIRVICDESGLSLIDKNTITAVIKAESGFNPLAENKNSNLSMDYGLCQFNDNPKYGWIGKGNVFETAQEVLDNPEKNVRVMIKEFKKGNLKYWSAFQNESYKKYL